ncbi:MAG: hypothetical protein J6W89_06485 [Paludibacteraceae bacterium]|nr:hypothetical protein [Paludibacteraceae bacterium]
MKSIKIISIVAVWLGVLPLLAQEGASVTVNADSTVSFCYCGEARRVSVQSDIRYTNEDSSRYTDHTRKIRMRKQSDGCYRVTTKPVTPETYTYCFRVNGKPQTDLQNNDTAWQTIKKWNIVSVGSTQQSDLYRQPQQRGTLHQLRWYSTNERLFRRVNIYLPAGYEQSVYPVLYLLHGINGYEGSWMERGRAIQIMENLAAEGKCQPMILVMPDVNVAPSEDKPSHRSLWSSLCNYSRLCHDHDIEHAVVELIQMVDTTYRVSGERLIAGLSDGARLAANVANLLPEYFQAVGLFSPVVHKDQLPSNIGYPAPTYYVYTGKGDFFCGNAKRFKRRLQRAQIPYEYTESFGGHNWRNWRFYLSDFLTKSI